MKQAQIKIREDMEQDREEISSAYLFTTSVPLSLVSVFDHFISYILDLVFAPYKAQAKWKCKLIRLNTDFPYHIRETSGCGNSLTLSV